MSLAMEKIGKLLTKSRKRIEVLSQNFTSKTIVNYRTKRQA